MGITKIGLQNFRVFKEMQEIDLAPITVFTGKNNSGKSSVIKALLLLSENSEDNRLEELKFNLKQFNHNLENFKSILNNKEGEFVFKYTYNAGKNRNNILVNLFFERNRNNRNNGKLKKIVCEDTFNEETNKFLILDRDTLQIDATWFYKDLKRQDIVSYYIKHHGQNEAMMVDSTFFGMYSSLRGYPFGFIGETFFKDKLKTFKETEIKEFGEIFHYYLLNVFTSISNYSRFVKIRYYSLKKFLYAHEYSPISYFNKITVNYLFEIFHFYTEGNTVIQKKSADKLKKQLLIVGNTLLKEIISLESLWDVIKNIALYTDIFLSGIKYMSFDYLEINKTNLQHVVILKNVRNSYEKSLLNYEYLDFENKIKKEVEGHIYDLRRTVTQDVELKKYRQNMDKDATEIEKMEDSTKFFESIKNKVNNYKVVKLNEEEFSLRFKNKVGYDYIIDNKKVEKDYYFEEGENIIYYKKKNTKTEDLKEYINYWIGEKGFDIGSDIKFNKTKFAMEVEIQKDGNSVNIADLGTGSNQVLAILLKIMFFKGKNLIIEEPETNLHPSLQSKLAEMFVDAHKKFKINFIIETHSEYLIRKLQYLTAKKVIKPEDAAIYYFNNPKDIKTGEKQVERLKIREDGMLDGDFGTGFFDESVKLTMDLLKIQNLS